MNDVSPYDARLLGSFNASHAETLVRHRPRLPVSIVPASASSSPDLSTYSYTTFHLAFASARFPPGSARYVFNASTPSQPRSTPLQAPSIEQLRAIQCIPLQGCARCSSTAAVSPRSLFIFSIASYPWERDRGWRSILAPQDPPVPRVIGLSSNRRLARARCTLGYVIARPRERDDLQPRYICFPLVDRFASTRPVIPRPACSSIVPGWTSRPLGSSS